MNAMTAADVMMMKTVKKTVDADRASYDVTPIFSPLYTKVCDNLSLIEKLNLVAISSTKPATKEKKLVLKELCNTAQTIAGLVGAYANHADNAELVALMNVKAYQIERLSAELQVSTCQNITDTAAIYQKSAEPFGLTQAKLNAFNNLIDVYKADLPDARTQQGNIDTAKKGIIRLVNENLNILEKMLDPVVEALFDSNPRTVEHWRFARKVVKPHTTHTTLKVILKDKVTKAPLAEVPVTASGKDTFTTSTSAEGEALWRPFPFGVYHISANPPGYLPFERKKVKVVKGKVNRIEALLEKAPLVLE